jgi:hypothetical protein
LAVLGFPFGSGAFCFSTFSGCGFFAFSFSTFSGCGFFAFSFGFSFSAFSFSIASLFCLTLSPSGALLFDLADDFSSFFTS